MFTIPHLDESTVTINWSKPVNLLVSYNVTLSLNSDSSVVEERKVTENGIQFAGLRQLTYYTLVVQAIVNAPLKLPLVDQVSFRTGKSVQQYVHMCSMYHYVCIHTYYAHMHAHMYAYRNIYTYVCIQKYIHMYIHTYVHVRIKCVHMYVVYIYIYTYIHTYISTCV